MSASGVRELMHTADGVREVAKTYLGLQVSMDAAAKCVLPATEVASHAWRSNPLCVSAGPVAWLKIRLQELGVIAHSPPDEPDDLPIHFRKAGRRLIPIVSFVARSQVFRTPLVIEPINLITRKVAGWRF